LGMSALAATDHNIMSGALEFYRLFREANTTGVYGSEKPGMQKYLKELHPECFEDIVTLHTLFRPDSIKTGLMDDFILHRHDSNNNEFLYPQMEPILEETNGVIIYDEKFMQIARVIPDSLCQKLMFCSEFYS